MIPFFHPKTVVIILPTQTMHYYKGLTHRLYRLIPPQMGNIMTHLQWILVLVRAGRDYIPPHKTKDYIYLVYKRYILPNWVIKYYRSHPLRLNLNNPLAPCHQFPSCSRPHVSSKECPAMIGNSGCRFTLSLSSWESNNAPGGNTALVRLWFNNS